MYSTCVYEFPRDPMIFFFLGFGFWVLETGFLCVALAVLELTLWTRLVSNSEIYLPLPPKCWDLKACATTAWI